VSAAERVQVIDRSVQLLDALAREPMSLTELSRFTGISKGTAFRLLAGLAQHGLVIKDPVGTDYLLGPGLLRFVHGALSGLGAIATLGQGVLQELQRITGETVALHAQSGVERVCIGEIPSSQTIRYSSGVGSSAPLNVGAAGKILMSMLPPHALERALASLRAAHPEIDVHELRNAVQQATDLGRAVSHGERVDGASAVSVAVPTHAVLLSLTVLGPSHRMTEQVISDLTPTVTSAAERLQKILEDQTIESELTLT